MLKLKEQQADSWAAPPETKVVKVQTQVPKINEEIEQDEFLVEIPESPSLKGLKNLKSLAIQIKDKESKKVLLEHCFEP